MHRSALSELGEALRSELQTLLNISADVDDVIQLDQDAQQLWQMVEREFAALAGELTASFNGSDLIGPFSPRSEAEVVDSPRTRSPIASSEFTAHNDESIQPSPRARVLESKGEQAHPMTPLSASAPESFMTQPQAIKSAASNRPIESEVADAPDVLKLQSSPAKQEQGSLTGPTFSETAPRPAAQVEDRPFDVELPSRQSTLSSNQPQSSPRPAEMPQAERALGRKGRAEPGGMTATHQKTLAAPTGPLTSGTPAPLQEPGVFQNVKSLRDLAQVLTAGPYVEPQTPQAVASAAAPEVDSSFHPLQLNHQDAAQQIDFAPEAGASLPGDARVTSLGNGPNPIQATNIQATNVEASADLDHDLESILEALSRTISEEYRRFYRS